MAGQTSSTLSQHMIVAIGMARDHTGLQLAQIMAGLAEAKTGIAIPGQQVSTVHTATLIMPPCTQETVPEANPSILIVAQNSITRGLEAHCPGACLQKAQLVLMMIPGGAEEWMVHLAEATDHRLTWTGHHHTQKGLLPMLNGHHHMQRDSEHPLLSGQADMRSQHTGQCHL